MGTQLRRTSVPWLRLALLLGTLGWLLVAGEPIRLTADEATGNGTIPPVRDLIPGDPTQAHASPMEFVSLDGVAYFVATDSSAGAELWRSAGTEGTTWRVKDIYPGAPSSGPRELTVVNGALFFTANDGSNGAELWVSDGSAAGTQMVRDLYPGTATEYKAYNAEPTNSSTPRLLTPAGPTLYFVARDVEGDGVWRSDGTGPGTTRVALADKGGITTITDLAVASAGIFFISNDGTGMKLWHSDATSGATTQISAAPQLGELTVADAAGPLFFTSYDNTQTELWQVNADGSGATALATLYPFANTPEFQFAAQITAAGDGTVYFRGYTEETGVELWRAGLGQGAALVQDLNPGPDSSFFVPLTTSGQNGALYFTAFDNAAGYELWYVDGLGLGSVWRVRDINPGAASALALTKRAQMVGSTLYFVADNGVQGAELWRSDGTPSGTTLVKDIRPGLASGLSTLPGPATLGELDGKVLFAADDGTVGSELWISDGSAAGTTLVRDLHPAGNANVPPFPDLEATLYPQPENLTVVERRGLIFFTTFDTKHGTRLWRSDGNRSGTIELKQIDTNPYSSFVEFMHPTGVRESLFFAAPDPVSGVELWKSDGEPDNTVLVKDIFTATQVVVSANAERDSYPTQLTNVRGTLFFAARNTNDQYELWKSDGSSNGTVRVRSSGTAQPAFAPAWLTALHSLLFYTADDGQHGVELWRSDGSDSGTFLVKDIYTGTGNSAAPSHLVAAGNQIFFYARDATGFALWRSDGTPDGTLPLLPADALYDRLQSGADHPMVAINGVLFFVHSDPTHGAELWRSDGSPGGTGLVKDIAPGPAGSFPTELAHVGGYLYFSAQDGVHGYELWRSDGTAEGTVLVKEIYPGPTGSHPQSIVALGGGRALFAAADPQHGMEIWVTDGTDAGTYLLVDLVFGPESANPTDLTVVGDHFCFVADDGQIGREVWCLPNTITPGARIDLYLPQIGR
jgi:ELWxxDGT repeat protein